MGAMATMNALHGLPAPVRVIRSRKRRRTLSLLVRSDEIVVRAPWRASDEAIQALLLQKRTWIHKVHAELVNKRDTRDIIPAFIWYLGELVPLQVQASEATVWSGRYDTASFVVSGPALALDSTKVRDIIYAWYRREALRMLPPRLTALAQTHGFDSFSVRIKTQQTRWGSCSAKRNINLNWRLILTPPWVMDYVMIHELCHLQEMNHSSRFWQLVATLMPDYEAAKAWLRQHADELRW